MSTIVNEVRKGFYLDSVALMRLSAEIAAMGGIEEAVLMIGTPSNIEIMQNAGVLNETGAAASPNDLVIALRADGKGNANRAIAHANKTLEGGVKSKAADNTAKARTLKGGINLHPQANLALVSTPGTYAAREARNALTAGLNVMIFSDNVSLEDETSLKRQARNHDLLVMGPDCGTAYINGVPLAFANSLSHVSAPASTGVIAASGTGLQEFAVLLTRLGGNMKHGIGVGGRDLSDAVGAISTLQAIDLLATDKSVEQIVLISKPPGPDTAEVVFTKLQNCGKKVIACVFGYSESSVPESVQYAATLQQAAELAAGNTMEEPDHQALADTLKIDMDAQRTQIIGLYSGGTLCTETQLVLQSAGLPTASNACAGTSKELSEAGNAHQIIDLGADEYTVGRPHPMMEPLVRQEALQQGLNDSTIAAIVIDVVLGYGAHENPTAVIVEALNNAPDSHPVVIAYVCGTESDPQNLTHQRNALSEAGAIVCESNSGAAELAAAVVQAP
ncbi:MAG: acyl-CoA synthetase FdrA [Pseudomonadota bacterium]